MYTITKKYRVEYAHQLNHAVTKACYETIHGHSGIIELSLCCDTLNSDGMVLDFGAMGEIKNYIMDMFDHALFMSESFDKEYLDVLKKYNKKLVIYPKNVNPTAESFAKAIHEAVTSILNKAEGQDTYKASYVSRNLVVSSVKFHETESGMAQYTES